MRRKPLVLCLSLVLLLCLTVGCGKNSSVKYVESIISSIGKVELSSESSINAARAAYDALSDKDKQQVENYAGLLNAEKKLTQLKEEAEEAAKLDITGTWSCTFLGMDLIYVFNSDGTYKTYNQTRIAEGTEGTYVFDGQTLTIIHDGKTITNSARKEDSVLIITVKGTDGSSVDTIWRKE